MTAQEPGTARRDTSGDWAGARHPAPELAGCGCPETNGKIYHQRGTCTDPTVEALDWYADSGRIAAVPEAPGTPEPGQAAMHPLAVKWFEIAQDLDDGPYSADNAAEAETLRECARQLNAAREPQPAPGGQWHVVVTATGEPATEPLGETEARHLAERLNHAAARDWYDARRAEPKPVSDSQVRRHEAQAAAECNDGRPVRWDDTIPPGGYVCAVPDGDGICGYPVESEPCNRHGAVPAPGGELSGHVTVRFPAGIVAAAKQIAAAEGMTVSAWIRREVEREAARREQPAPRLPAENPGFTGVTLNGDPIPATSGNAAAVAPDLGTAWRLADERRKQLEAAMRVIEDYENLARNMTVPDAATRARIRAGLETS